jgi:hypothetical protein
MYAEEASGKCGDAAWHEVQSFVLVPQRRNPPLDTVEQFQVCYIDCRMTAEMGKNRVGLIDVL